MKHPSLAAVLALTAACFLQAVPESKSATDTKLPPVGEAADVPLLRIETGVHTAIIRRLGTDAANRYLVTSSDDKTVRVWDLAKGTLLHVFRPPLGEGNEGKVYAVAITPDAKLVACGGWMKRDEDKDECIFLFDRATGKIVRHIGGFTDATLDLAFSRDGKLLAVVLGNQGGLHVFDTETGAEVAKDSTYGDMSNSVDFDAKGRLVTSSYDGLIRLYNESFKCIAKVDADAKKRPFCARFSPDGQQVAVGFSESLEVQVYSGNDLSLYCKPDVTGMELGKFSSVVWSPDSKYLYAAGEARDENLQHLLRRWDKRGRGGGENFLVGAANTVLDLRALRDGSIAWGTAEPSWGVVAPDGSSHVLMPSPVPSFRGLRKEFVVSEDGQTFQFGYKGNESLATFSLENRVLKPADTVASLQTARIMAPGLEITGWKESYEPKIGDKRLKLTSYEFSRCLAISPDASEFLLGTEWAVRCFGRDGTVKWAKDAPGIVWAVNMGNEGKVAMAAYNDGTIRWHRMSDGMELLAFFPHADQKRWVLWTPGGYYDCSAGGEDLIGWHVNRTRDEPADFFPASRFRDVRYRPEVIANVLQTLDEKKAVAMADSQTGKRPQEETIASRLPPIVRITAPADNRPFSERELKIRYTLRTPSGEPVTTVRAIVDGRPVVTDYDVDITAPTEQSGEITVRVPPRDCVVSLIAENKFAPSDPAILHLKWRSGGQPTEPLIKPKLYLLAIGISKYKDTSLELDFADKDAQGFAAAMLGQKGLLYEEVVTRILPNEEATKNAILDGLDWIEKQTTSKDVAMVFFSGHGKNSPTRDYYFLPYDYESASLKRTGIAFTDIRTTAANIAGKAVFFIDSCHSGSVMGTERMKGERDITKVINELSDARNGVVVFSSSTSEQTSIEDQRWGHGAFTKALLEGLDGKADFQDTGRVTVMMMSSFISEEVKKLTGGRQAPTTQIPPTVPDFPMAARR